MIQWIPIIYWFSTYVHLPEEVSAISGQAIAYIGVSAPEPSQDCQTSRTGHT